MPEVPLLDGWTRLLLMVALPAGALLIGAALWLLRRRAQATGEETSGPGAFSWPVILGVAGVMGLLGASFVWLPYQFVRGARMTDDALELRYLFPRGRLRITYPAISGVTLVESCELLRSGWRTRSRLELTVTGATVEPIEGERATLVRLANALEERTGHPPRYEARNRDLAASACVTESPWPDAH